MVTQWNPTIDRIHANRGFEISRHDKEETSYAMTGDLSFYWTIDTARV